MTDPHFDIPNSTGVLYRSRIEILHILEELAHKGAMLYSAVEGGERLFLSRMLHVDPAAECLYVEYGEQHPSNDALLDQQAVLFVAYHEGARVEFEADAPVEAEFGGLPAVRFALPVVLVRSHRREHPRYPVPEAVSLRCVADDAGVMPFEARVVDISLGGLGGMTYDAAITLPTGTVLRGCRIVVPGRKAIVTDLEVRYTVSVVQADGSLVNRSGVRFVKRPAEIDALIDIFVHNLDGE